MKTMELLNLDCTKEENAEIIQKALKRIKQFSKCEDDVELEKLEKLKNHFNFPGNMQIF
jgi:virulence-associated protein VapD